MDDANVPVGWLLCRPFRTIAITPGQRLTIGRQGCDLTLPHKGISRHHATVDVDGGALRLTDRSSNGTYLNGKRMERPARLRAGDAFAVGPFEITVHDAPPSDDTIDGTRPAGVMAGRIEAMPLGEVVSGLIYNKRSGELRVRAGKREGLLVVQSGEAVEASIDDLRDEAAVLELLALERGQFVFAEGDMAARARRIERPLATLLMEAASGG